MKTVYFVRHGESEGNAGTHYQLETTPLTKTGREQASSVAERAKRLPVQVIISSTMMRAKETANAISEANNIPIEFSELFIERRRPSEQINQLKQGEQSILAEEAIIKNSGIPGYRYSDEENFDDLKVRAEKALAFLTQHPSENILVVTHGVFLRVLVTFAIFGTEVTEREFKGMLSALIASNTGLTILQHDSSKASQWFLLTWNDHAHLG